jgi:hypothetical protein
MMSRSDTHLRWSHALLTAWPSDSLSASGGHSANTPPERIRRSDGHMVNTACGHLTKPPDSDTHFRWSDAQSTAWPSDRRPGKVMGPRYLRCKRPGADCYVEEGFRYAVEGDD